MNYSQTLPKAKTLLEQGHDAQAVQTAAGALENLLVELYNELLGQSAPARQRQLIEAQEKVGGGQPLNKLTLGKLVGVYRASRAYEDLPQMLGRPPVYLNVDALDPLVDIRNRAVHQGHEPDPAEAAYVVNQVELILREAGTISPSPAAQERGSGGEAPLVAHRHAPSRHPRGTHGPQGLRRGPGPGDRGRRGPRIPATLTPSSGAPSSRAACVPPCAACSAGWRARRTASPSPRWPPSSAAARPIRC